VPGEEEGSIVIHIPDFCEGKSLIYIVNCCTRYYNYVSSKYHTQNLLFIFMTVTDE
jgi:hypothetical protein